MSQNEYFAWKKKHHPITYEQQAHHDENPHRDNQKHEKKKTHKKAVLCK